MPKINHQFQNTSLSQQREVLGEKLGFIGLEAYKQLRTNIIYSLPDTNTCKTIAVTSAEAADGKSTTSVNLAYALAASGDKVVLLEGDMRLPYTSQRLQLKSAPGLSDILVGKSEVADALQKADENKDLFVLTAGSPAPNPSELLTSEKMEMTLQTLQQAFDYIIFDLPPLNDVTDASSMAKNMDGYVIVVRQNKTRLRSLRDAMDQLKLVDGKVLGFVLNDVKISNHRYGKSYYGY